MLAAFLKGYRESGAPTISGAVGGVLGMLTRTAAQTVVVVLVLKTMGYLP